MTSFPELQIFQYEYFIKKSLELNRNEYRLPENSLKVFHDVKRKLNIMKEATKEILIKPTTLEKQEEIIASLFKLFNKITGKNYNKLSDQIFSLISKNISDKEKVCTTFFKVILNNSFFCSLYAKLYKGFIEISDDFEGVLKTQISNYVNNIDKIIYVSSNENYDKYCEYIKQVDGVKNFTNFIIQCLNENILESIALLKLAITFQTQCLNNIDCEEKLPLNEIYISNISIITKDSIKKIYKHEIWSSFISNHEELKKSRGSGTNKKIYFKLLDISEQIVV